MSKNIIFCADGTWNGLGATDGPDLDPDATNVLRFFATLDGDVTPDSLRLQDEQEKVSVDDETVTQAAKYIHGVGDSRNAIVRLLGGVFGEGFIERIVRGYTYLSRNYEDGDRIFLVGFSRGAYTVRALGGMVTKMGLLPPDAALAPDGTWDADLAYRLGVSVWAQYRKAAGKESTLLGYLEEFKAEPIDPKRLVAVRIAAIGVWDTVGALGIPVEDVADRERVDVFAFADTALSPLVERGFHAIAIDEQREDFEPTLWDGRDGIDQRWFAGAHADVGGGYPSLEFSSVSLDWMIARLRGVGVLFSGQYSLPGPFPFGPFHTPYTQPPFDLRPHGPRGIPEDALFHPSVQQRLAGYPDYAPDNVAPWLNGRALPPGMIAD